MPTHTSEKKSSLRVFIGLTEIAGYYEKLTRGLRELGIETTFINLYGHKFEYGGDDTDDYWLARNLKNLLRRKKDLHEDYGEKSPLRKLEYGAWHVLTIILQTLFFLWALTRYDVFLLNANSGFFLHSAYNNGSESYPDLPWLKFFGKRIIYHFHGGDARPPYLDVRSVSGNSLESVARHTERKKAYIREIETYADAIITGPLNNHFLEKPHISGWMIGLPIDISTDVERRPPNTSREAVRIVHAPSNPTAKGTSLIRQAIDHLKEQGYTIDYHEIKDQPNRVVLEELARCNFVVDQLFSTTPMAGLASEAAYFGRPTITGGYFTEFLEDGYPDAEMIPPVHACHPGQLIRAMEKLITDVHYRESVGNAAYEFVRNQWSPRSVARRYVRIFADSIPEDWWQDPSKTKYVHGLGLPASRSKEFLRSFIEFAGTDALQVDDKPELKEHLIRHAFGENAARLRNAGSERKIVSAMIEKAKAAIQEDDMETANRLLRNCINISSNDPRPYLLLSRLAHANNEKETATSLLLQAAELDAGIAEQVSRQISAR